MFETAIETFDHFVLVFSQIDGHNYAFEAAALPTLRSENAPAARAKLTIYGGEGIGALLRV